jgi:hypothetical protein
MDILPMNNTDNIIVNDDIINSVTTTYSLVDNNDILYDIIKDIQSEKIPSLEIRKKYNLSHYQYYRLIKTHNLKKNAMKKGPKCPTGEKKTKFKQLLFGTPEQQKQAKIIPENLNIEDFKSDCTENKLKISDLMSKYNLTLYQVREMRILYDVKTK